MLLNTVSLLLLEIILGDIASDQPTLRGTLEHMILELNPVFNLI